VISAVMAFAKGVPILAWALMAALAWGAYQRHDAKSQERQKHAVIAKVAAEEAEGLRATIAESKRRVAAHQEIASAAQARVEELERSAAAARVVVGRVRPAATAYAASAVSRGASAPGDCKAAEDAANLFAELLGRTANRAAELADLADRSRAAGQACEASYDTLNK
jgi:hypothetical protein